MSYFYAGRNPSPRLAALTQGKGWATVFDVDLATLAVQDFAAGGDGAYQIGKVTATIDNTAAAATFDLDGATGLRIFPAQTSNISASPFTCPNVQIPLTQFVPGSSLKFGDGVRVWLYATAVQGTQTADGQGHGMLYRQTADTGGAARVSVFANRNSGVNSFALRTIDGFANTTLGPPDVLVQEIMSLTQRGRYFATYGTDWPAVSSLVEPDGPHCMDAIAVGSAHSWVPETDYVQLYAQRNGSATAWDVTFHRLRVDVLTGV